MSVPKPDDTIFKEVLQQIEMAEKSSRAHVVRVISDGALLTRARFCPNVTGVAYLIDEPI
jgi:ribosomal protein L4